MEVEPLDSALSGRLRAEACGMAEAYVEVLQAACPDGTISAVYAKGSAFRAWDSAIDYVPELSDVDLHVRLARDAGGLVRTLPFALDVAEGALALFNERFPQAVHVPRPQLFFLQDLERLPGYVPSPAGCVCTLLGDEYVSGTPGDYVGCARSDAERFLIDARFVLEELPGKVIDRPGRQLWGVVSRMTWRVAPAGPRLLTQLGMDPYDAWSVNRSTVVRELTRRGHPQLAGPYGEFYMAGWAGFRSRFEDGDAARQALTSASRLYAEGSRVLSESEATAFAEGGS